MFFLLFFSREMLTNFDTKSFPGDQWTQIVFESKQEPLLNRKEGHPGHKTTQVRNNDKKSLTFFVETMAQQQQIMQANLCQESLRP
jgi:hypothetical protein